MSPKTYDGPEAADDYEAISCLTCGSVWRIKRYTDDSKIDAELLICPLCVEREKEQGGESGEE